MKPKLKPPVIKRLRLHCDEALSTFAFKFNLRRYMKAAARVKTEAQGLLHAAGAAGVAPTADDIPSPAADGFGADHAVTLAAAIPQVGCWGGGLTRILRVSRGRRTRPGTVGQCSAHRVFFRGSLVFSFFLGYLELLASETLDFPRRIRFRRLSMLRPCFQPWKHRPRGFGWVASGRY